MALIQSDSGVILEVEQQSKAARTTLKANDSLAWNIFGASTGLITGIAANGAIFSFRNMSANKIVFEKLGINFVLTTAFTTPQRLEFAVLMQRAFIASDTGGTQIAFTGNNTKSDTTLLAPSNVDCRIATTTALTPGTKTPDANYLAIQPMWAAPQGANLITDFNLIKDGSLSHPIILNQNEGFNIVLPSPMGAAGVGVAYVNGSFAEMPSYL